MISYDEYKNRIEKLAKVKGKLHKFRFLICGALAVVIGGSVGLMVTKGTYMSATEVSAATVNFNEPLQITPAKAFLASARSQKIQYAGEDGEWTEEMPVKAGRYQVRTVSPKIVGYSYSKPVSFEILPLQSEFTIVGESVTYGDVPDYTITNLVSGHKVDESALAFNYQNYNSPSTVVSVDASTLKIIDPATGEDYTSCYVITSNEKQLSISNRQITVRPVNQTAVYDGKGVAIENKVTDDTLSQLAKGDEIRVSTKIQQNYTSIATAVDAGTYSLFADNVSVWHGNDDVTARYDMQFLYGQLQIDRRVISVSVGGGSKEYDDTPLVCSDFTSENLAEGHKVVLEDLPSITEVGSIKNQCYVAVKDGGSDVTANYRIDSTYGTLQILPKKVKIITADAEKIYDGKPLFDTHIEHNDESGRFVYYAGGTPTMITDYSSGGVKNIFTVEATRDGILVTKNFEFEYEYGTLKINKRPVRIITGGLNEHYNGKEQNNPDATATDGGKVDGGLLTELDHRLQVVGKPLTVTDVTAADGVDNTTEYAIYDGARNVTENYDISYKYGKLIITARPIVVQIASKSWVYDGEEHYDTGYETYYQEDESQSGLVLTGDALTPKTWTKVKNFVAGTTNEVTYDVPNANYKIAELRGGVLAIDKRVITVTTVSRTWEYDGEQHFDPDYETDTEKTYHLDEKGVKQPALIGGDKLTVVEGSYFKITDVLDSNKNIVKYDVPNENYGIAEVIPGKLEVTRRKIIIVTFDGTWVYDGEAHSKEGYDTKWATDETQKGLVGDDKLIESNSYSNIINVADPDPRNMVEFNNAPNYEIVREDWGKLKITPRPIKVATVSHSWTYDGKEHSVKELDEAYTETYFVDANGDRATDIQGNGAGLVKAGEVLTLIEYATITEVSEIDNKCSFNTPNINYTIVGYDEGKLSVSGRYIKVVTVDKEWTYDGEEHYDTTYTTYQVDEDGNKISDDEAIVDGTKLEPVASSVVKITNCGTATNQTRFTVPEVNGKVNYVIYGYDDGELTVNQRVIVVTTATKEWEYDGQNHSDTTYKTKWADGEGKGLLGEDELTLIEGSQTVVNEVTEGEENRVEYSLPLFDGVHSNYSVEYEYGTLTVTKRIVVVSTGTTHREYNGEVLKNEQYKVYRARHDGDGYEYIYDESGNLIDGEVINEVTGIKDVLVLTKTKPFPTIVNVGEIPNDPEFANDNYEIHYGYGKLVVTKRNILVTTGSNEWTYDGKEHSETEYEKVEYATSSEGGGWHAVPGDALVVNALTEVLDTLALVDGTATKIKDAGNAENKCEYANDNYDIHYAYGTLTVERKKININLNALTVTYGDDLPETSGYTPVNASVDALADGETLTVYISYALDGTATTPKDRGEYATIYKSGEIETEGSTAKVTAEKNYKITCADGTLKIERREVTVKIDDQSVTYGTALPENGFTLAEGSLEFADGETLTLDYYYKEVSAPVNKGTYTISYTEKYINGKTEGVDNYDLTVIDGTLDINAFKITIQIEDANYKYGVAITGKGDQFRINGSTGNRVATGVTFGGVKEFVQLNAVRFEGLAEGEMPKNVGTYTVTATEDDFTFDNNNLEECSAGNYEIVEIKSATLTIEKKEITVELTPFADTNIVYGNTYTYGAAKNNYANAGTLQLAYNEKLEVAVKYKDANGEYGTPKNAGTYTAELDEENCVIYDENGDAIDGGVDNYDITCDPLTDLRIARKGITVTLLDYEVTYGDYTFEDGDDPYEIEIGNHKVGEGITPELEYGEQIKIMGVIYDNGITPRNAGSYQIRVRSGSASFHSYEIYDEDDNLIKDGTYNYVFGNKPGYLTIKAKAITVHLSDYSVEYGEKRNYPAGEGLNGTGNFKLGENAPDLSYGDLLKVNGVKYHESGENEVEHFNKGDYNIAVDGGYKLYDKYGDEIPVTNYSITTVVGKLTVTARKVTVSVVDKNCVYGEALPANDFKVSKGGVDEDGNLPYGETFTVGYHYELLDGEEVTPVNAGNYYIVGTVTAVNGAHGALINYDISYEKGVLEIEKADLMVTLSSFTAVYGDEIVYPEGTGENGTGNYVSAVTLQNGDTLKVAVGYIGDDGKIYVDASHPLGAPKNCQNYKITLNTAESIVYDINGNTHLIEDNYEVDVNTGTLKITQRNVTITSAQDVTCHYGNDDLDVPDPTVTTDTTDGKLPYGEKFTYIVQYLKDYIFYGEPVSVGEYELQQHVSKVLAEDGTEALAANYKFTYEHGKVTVEKKVINIELKKDVNWNYGTYQYGVSASDEFDGKTPSTCAYDPVAENDTTAFDEVLEVNIRYYDEDGKIRDFPKNYGTYKIEAVSFTVYSHREENNPYGATGQETKKGNELTNYIINCEDGLLTVNKLDVNVEIPNDIKTTYGFAKFPAVTPSITRNGEEFTLPYGEKFEYAFKYYLDGELIEGLPVNAGTYKIVGEIVKVNATENGATAEVVGGKDNYSVTWADGELLIRQKKVTVTVTDKECFYGEALPALNPAITGMVDGETLDITFKFVKGSDEYDLTDNKPQNADVYAIKEDEVGVTGGQELVSNYDITYNLGQLEIKALPITVKVNGATATYGGALPEITYSVTSANQVVDGETLALTFKFVDKDGAEFNQTDKKPVNAGTYGIFVASESVTGGNALVGNYVISYEENAPKLVIGQSAVGKIELNAEVSEFAYGENYDESITDVVVNGVNGQKIVVKVKYYKVPSASETRARSARAYASRAAEAEEAFIPKNVGGYGAALDWANCLVYDGETLIEGGIANYSEPECAHLLFSIIELEVEITIKSNGFTYGGTLPAIESEASVELPYGETYELTYKFTKDGKTYNQTDNKPRTAGEYAISADTITFKAGGELADGNNYKVTYAKNDPKLTIEKREISIALKNDLQFAFGETGVYEAEAGNYRTDAGLAPDLAEGDALTVTGVTFVKLDEAGNEVGAPETAPTDAGVYAIKYFSFKVMHGDEDVTASYDLTDAADGRLEISASVIRVKSADGEWEYDGGEHTVSDYSGGVQILAGSFGEDAEDYEIVVDELCYVKDVTEGAKNKTTFKVKYKGADTNNFDVVVEEGTFVVTAREIEIKTESNEKAYDGTPLNGKTEANPDGYTVTYKGTGANKDALVGNTFKVIKDTTVTDVTDKPVDNELTFDIVDGEGKSVLSNFAITKVWGKLQVNPLEVEIKIKDVAIVYGESIEVDFTVEAEGKEISLPEGEQFKFDTAIYNSKTFREVIPEEKDGYTLINVGSYLISITGDVTVEGGKISNYTVNRVVDGNLTVEAREITVKTLDGGMDGGWIYDGLAHYMHDYETALASDETKAGLLDDDTLNATGWATITDAGEKANTATFTVPNGNYKIADGGISYGTLKVSVRKITVLTGTIGDDEIIIYDGNKHSTNAADCVEGTSLVSGHTLAVDGTAFGYEDATGAAGVDNTTKFKVVDATGSDKVNKNYEITHKYGKIIIAQRPVTICSNDITATYNGSAHSDNGLSIADDSEYVLVTGHKIKAGTGTAVYDVTEGTPNDVTYQIVDGEGANKTANYKVTFNAGTIVINPATLKINLKHDLEIEYGDLTYASKLFVSADGLVDGETFNGTFEVDKVVDGIGPYTATLDLESCTVTNARGDDGLKNYVISADSENSATFEVVAKQLTLNLATGVSVPYGTEYESKLTKNLFLNTAYNETLVIKLVYDVDNPVNVGTYIAKIDWANCEVYDYKGNLKANGLDNYELTNEGDEVTFKITKVTLTVDMEDIGPVKYGDEYSYADEKGNYRAISGLVNGEDIKVKPVYMQDGKELAGAPTFAGVYDIVFKAILEVYDAEGNVIVNGASNYNVVCKEENYGKLTITGVNVTVIRHDITTDYNGKPYALAESNCPASEVTLSYLTSDGEMTVLPEGYELRLRAPFATNSANADTYNNTAEYVIWDLAADSESGEYVAKTEGAAIITINKKVALLTTAGGTKVYDGTELTGDYTLSISNPIAGHTYQVVNRAKVTYVTENPVDNEITFKFLDENGKDVTVNYDMQLVGEYGKLQVTACEVTVTLADMTAVYGEDFTVKYTLTSGGVSFGFPTGEAFTFDVTYTAGGAEAEKLTLGNYAVNYVEGSAKINGAESANYVINFANHGTLEITARAITVTTISDEWVYDGDEHFNTDYETGVDKTYYLDEEGNKKAAFVNGDGLTAKATGYSIVKNYNGDGVDNVVEYEADENYIVTLNYGKLKITKRTVTVVTGSATKERYDGTALSAEDPEECYYTSRGENDGLVGGDSLVLVGKAISIINATSGNGTSNKNVYKIVNADGEDSENYVIKYSNGWLKIGKAELTIILTANESYQYGDKSFKEDVLSFADGDISGLVEGEELTIAVRYYLNGKLISDPKDVADGYEVRFNANSSKVDNGRTGNGISNYTVICESIYFNITPKDVTLTLTDWTDVTYDGTVHDMQEGKLTIPADAFEYGETLTIAYAFTADGAAATPVNAGTYTVKLSLTESLMSDGNPLETNYNVSWTGGKDETQFTINKKDLTVALNAVTVDYDGNYCDFTEITGAYDITGLCASDAADLTVEYYDGSDKLTELPVFVNDTAYTVKFVSLDFTSGSADNYSFDDTAVADGSLKIDRRAIKITVASKTAEEEDAEYGADDIIHSYKGEEGFGFVSNDLTDAFASGELAFAEPVLLPAQADDLDKGIIARYQYSLTVTEGDMLKNYTVTSNEAGELIVVKTMIKVNVKAEDIVYNGQSVPADNFSFTNGRVKNPAQTAFSDEELAQITAVYDIVNDDNAGDTYQISVDGNGTVTGAGPVDAGKYTVTLTLTGEPMDGYYISNAETGLTTKLAISPRPVTLKITEKDGYTASAVYGDFTIDMVEDFVNDPEDISEGEDCGFVEGFNPTFTIRLVEESGYFANDYNAGNYFVGAQFSGMANYALTMQSSEFVIEKRLLVVAPDAKSGTEFDYAGQDLQLTENDWKLLLDTTLANGDSLTIESTTVPVTQTAGNVTISQVFINGGMGNGNYKIICTAVSDPALAGSGLSTKDFRVRLSYNLIMIDYEQVLSGGAEWQFDYDGSKHEVTIGEDVSVLGGVIRIVGENGLYDASHDIRLTKNTFEFTDAGVYANWFDSRLQVVDGSGRKVACYVLNNVTNSEDNSKKVFVNKNEIEVAITVNKADLVSGSALTDSFDGINKKLASGVTVNGLAAGHKCEVILFNVEGELVLGVTVFAENNGKRKDVIANYGCKDIVLTVDSLDVTARYITVDEIKVLACPVLRVNLPAGITADNLLENCTLTDGVYYLNGVTYSALTDAAHSVKTVVYGKDGALTVGVVITNGTGEGSGLYNVILPEIEGVGVEVLKVTEFKKLVRMLVIDLTASFNADGTPKTDADGRLQNVNVTGLAVSDKYEHIVEIIYADGEYKITVYQKNVLSNGTVRRSDKQSEYDFAFKLPESASVTASDFVRVDVTEVYPK